MKRIWPDFLAHPGWVLAVAVAVEVFLFASAHVSPFRHVSGSGEGCVITGDGLGYYAWLRSPLIDGDLSFANEFDEHNPLHHVVPQPGQETPAGYRRNPWSVGPACVWALTVVPGHLCLRALQGPGSSWPADGYSLPYQFLVGLTTLLVSFIGLGFLYGICRQYARPLPAALTAALLTLGTSLVFYNAVEGARAHGAGATVLAGLVWYWLRTYGSTRPARWLLLGGLVGLAALMRWQLLTYAVLPAAEALLAFAPGCAGRPRRWPWGAAGRLALAALGAVLGVLPQLAAWRIVYGQWLASPIPVRYHWLAPSVGQMLLSADRSLFYWTPLAALAVAASLVCLARGPGAPEPEAGPAPPAPRLPQALLVLAFCAQVYVLGSMWGGKVHLGSAFGFRHLTESLVPLAPGLALLLDRAPARRFRLLCGLGCLLALWNLALIYEFRLGLIPRGVPVALATLFARTRGLAHCKQDFALLGAALFLLFLPALSGRREPARPLAADLG